MATAYNFLDIPNKTLCKIGAGALLLPVAWLPSPADFTLVPQRHMSCYGRFALAF
jgi:hypothetical protein